MKKTGILLFLCVSGLLSAKDIRLDTLKDIKFDAVNLSAVKNGWKMDKVLSVKSDVYLDIKLPKVYTVTKLVFDLPKYKITRGGLDSKEYPGLYCFEILCMDPVYKEMKTVNTYSENTLYSLTLKEKFKTDSIRIKLNQVFPGAVYCYWGGIGRMQIYGFEGEEAKKEKINKEDIKTAEEAKEAYRDGVLTSAEYVELLKNFK